MSLPTALLGRLRARHLALVVALDTHRSLRRAAAEIALTQPAATKLLHDLEDALGAPLFERHAWGMSPTPYGDTLVRHARGMLNDLALPVAAQDYPTKPVRIMVGANAGGGTDVIARMLGEKLAESLKQPFVIENRPGASNTIAADLTAKAPADGHTLLVATNTGQAIAPHMIKLAFDPLKDLQPVGLIVVVPNVLVVGDKVPAKDVKELVALAKAKPGELRYASSGIGSTQHIAGEAFDVAAGIKTTHIPYKGSSQAHADILGGNVEMMFDTTSSAMPHIKSAVSYTHLTLPTN